MGDFIDKFSNVPLGQRLFLLLLVMAAVFLAYYMFFFSKMEEQLATLGTEEMNLNTQNAQLQRMDESQQQAEIALVEERRRRNALEVEMPDSDQYPNLLNQLHSTAEQVRVSSAPAPLEIVQVSRQPFIQDLDYTRIPIELRLRGTYQQVQAFCWDLAQMPRLIHVISLSMRPSTGRASPGPPVLDVLVSIEAFFRPS